jgi:hypothetical protein
MPVIVDINPSIIKLVEIAALPFADKELPANSGIACEKLLHSHGMYSQRYYNVLLLSVIKVSEVRPAETSQGELQIESNVR